MTPAQMAPPVGTPAPEMLPFDAYSVMLDGSWPQRVKESEDDE